MWHIIQESDDGIIPSGTRTSIDESYTLTIVSENERLDATYEQVDMYILVSLAEPNAVLDTSHRMARVQGAHIVDVYHYESDDMCEADSLSTLLPGDGTTATFVQGDPTHYDECKTCLDGPVFCGDCGIWLNGTTQWEDHKIGKKHKKNTKVDAQTHETPKTGNITMKEGVL